MIHGPDYTAIQFPVTLPLLPGLHLFVIKQCLSGGFACLELGFWVISCAVHVPYWIDLSFRAISPLARAFATYFFSVSSAVIDSLFFVISLSLSLFFSLGSLPRFLSPNSDTSYFACSYFLLPSDLSGIGSFLPFTPSGWLVLSLVMIGGSGN
jgi:hypothetical protein